MELALITAQQVAVLFLLIGTGMVAVKTGVLKLENKQALSNLLVYIIVPAMVVNSYRMEFSAQILRNLLAAFGMSVLSVLLGTVITLLLTARKTGSRMPIFRFACIFSNAAYMGFPLISALFGSEGLLYASAYVTVFNILLWTLGYGLVSGGSSGVDHPAQHHPPAAVCVDHYHGDVRRPAAVPYLYCKKNRRASCCTAALCFGKRDDLECAPRRFAHN